MLFIYFSRPGEPNDEIKHDVVCRLLIPFCFSFFKVDVENGDRGPELMFELKCPDSPDSIVLMNKNKDMLNTSANETARFDSIRSTDRVRESSEQMHLSVFLLVCSTVRLFDWWTIGS